MNGGGGKERANENEELKRSKATNSAGAVEKWEKSQVNPKQLDATDDSSV